MVGENMLPRAILSRPRLNVTLARINRANVPILNLIYQCIEEILVRQMTLGDLVDNLVERLPGMDVIRIRHIRKGSIEARDISVCERIII